MAKQLPLAERMRPRALADIVGQQHLVRPGKPLYRALQGEFLHSMVLWGPPGCGKTTIARLLAAHANAHYMSISAVTSGIKEIREALEQAQQHHKMAQQSLLFVDEVHRFNKVQQDAFLAHIENGLIIFIGATTENPAFELNRALLSRAPVYCLQPIKDEDIECALQRALIDCENGLACNANTLSDKALQRIVHAAHGDLRRAFSLLESVVQNVVHDATPLKAPISEEQVDTLLDDALSGFDKGGDQFYDLISALHKSIRGSNADAASYWAQRILNGGADPHYVLRRLVRIASEDIGNADPRALTIALNAWDAYDRLGAAEGELAIIQAVIYLSVAAKSNAVYKAHKRVQALGKQYSHAPVPLHLRNAPTALAKQQNHGQGYRYAHDEAHHYSAGQHYWPKDIPLSTRCYEPSEQGLEKKIAEKLSWLASLDSQGDKRQ